MFDGKRLLRSTNFFWKSTFKTKLRRNREPSRIPVKKVLNYLLKKMLQESNEKIYFKNFPVSSHLQYMICVNIIKHGLFNTIETMLVVGMCFLVQ